MNLQLSLIKKWFEMTKSGIKTEDYREITPYWINRLAMYQDGSVKFSKSELKEIAFDINACQCDMEELEYTIDNFYLNFKKFDINIMTLGYPKATDSNRILKFEHKGIEISTGNPEWGAEADKLYFVIKHGISL